MGWDAVRPRCWRQTDLENNILDLTKDLGASREEGHGTSVEFSDMILGLAGVFHGSRWERMAGWQDGRMEGFGEARAQLGPDATRLGRQVRDQVERREKRGNGDATEGMRGTRESQALYRQRLRRGYP